MRSVEKPTPVHGRIQTLDLTESGRALLVTARARMRAIEGELTLDLSAEEEALVRRWLVAVAITAAGRD